MEMSLPVAKVISEKGRDLSVFYGTIEKRENHTVHVDTGRNGVDEIRHSNPLCSDTQMLCHHLSLYSPIPVDKFSEHIMGCRPGGRLRGADLQMLLCSQSRGFKHLRKYYSETLFLEHEATTLSECAHFELEMYRSWLEDLTSAQRDIWKQWCCTDNARLRIIFMTA